ncbi:hypothetical protein [Pseudoflavonifractor phocaeensis]|uniref:hypothetical protein n=1 Tax=Pseudoflavonifractor phocaeensis TaxID=1870988 RepID=UPI00195A1484|nr:hypothetical protein [Pseudoflavonifractor phocaeensis]
MEPNEIKQRDRPGILARVSAAWEKWGVGVLLCGGAAALTVGAALIYPPAGWLTGGALAILGGILGAIGGGDQK